jgi:hypothetical protein
MAWSHTTEPTVMPPTPFLCTAKPQLRPSACAVGLVLFSLLYYDALSTLSAVACQARGHRLIQHTAGPRTLAVVWVICSAQNPFDSRQSETVHTAVDSCTQL